MFILTFMVRILNPLTVFRGVKNVVGGILTIDEKHHGCIQKSVCEGFMDGEFEHVPELDPVKRSWVWKKKVIRPPGKLRWIGDLVANGLSRVARRIGFVPSSNRRQSTGIMGVVADYAFHHWNKIPWHEMIQ